MSNHDYLKFAAEVSQRSNCHKAKVGAILEKDWRILGRGWNDAPNTPADCPRAHLPSGVGYDLCKSVCGQRFHAEVAAIQDALRNYYAHELNGATMYIAGHTKACGACEKMMSDYGIKWVIG